ncbi:MAG TPA: PBP1A family penicillin-binding protein [Rhizobacter sp.]|nr:PBP1A family penicillin-binding protein [Rhizobacter sp.]
MFRPTLRHALLALAGIALAATVAIGATLTVLYNDLPELGMLVDYQPRQPLRVFTREGIEIGEFGAERRYYLPIAHTPRLIQDAVLAIEDAGFREHPGVSLKGTLRAALANLWRSRSQGGSTITQQVARTFYLSSKKSYTRKLREALLALKIERHLGKDQILELYLNQIYLGQRAYGFEAAAQSYFGKPLTQLSVAETAMLAGLPQNPRYANPATNFERARKRQLLVLERMRATEVITPKQYEVARAEPLHVLRRNESPVHAEYVAEAVRQTIHAQYGEAAYSQGLKVTTSLRAADQQAAWRALRKGLIDYERRQPYRGPEDEEDLPEGLAADDPALAQALADHPDDDELRVALVSEAGPREVVATLASGEVIRITGDGLRQVQSALLPRAKAALRIRRGAVVRVVLDTNNRWSITQWPEAQGALVALDPQSGRMRALVGGFDFGRNQFNHATQAWRQPGSSFKPFLYSAAIENGVMPGTLVNDAPLPPDADGNPPEWDPKNADDQYDGPLSLRDALARSKNLVTIRLVQLLGPEAARQWAARFGFDADKHPADLTLALGSGSTTPLQLATAYAVLANGGHSIKPVMIERVTDAKGATLFEAPTQPLTEAERVVPARNAYLTDSLLQEVTRSGTAARAQAQLKRTDLYGKTGTTNDAVDAWFAGFQPSVAAVVWMGYDNPRSLGSRESGGGLSLPVWIDYMRTALQGAAVQELEVPEGLVQSTDGEWVYAPAEPSKP